MFVYLVFAITIKLSSASTPIENNAPALWALIDGTRSILISKEFNPTESSDIDYRYYSNSDGYNRAANVKPELWTTIQNGEKRDVRQHSNLIITKSSRPIFPPYIFFNFFQAEKFEMTHQSINSVAVTDFERANSLKYLNLSHNAIDIIVPFTFANAKHLEIIDLSYNAIISAIGEIFTSNNLHELYLDHNNLQYVEFLWLNFDALQVLTLNDNQIITIDQTPSAFPMKYGSKHFLTKFSVANNPMAVDTANKILMHADTIDISNINAKTCTISLNVQTFTARNNRIDNVRGISAVGNYSLIKLDVSHNLITTMANIVQFHRLKYLNVSHNALETLLRNDLHKLKHLVWLDLSNNRLKKIDFGFLRSTHALDLLDLSYNKLFFFRLNVITISLEELHVEGNNLTMIDTNLRRMAPKLKRIGLNDNDWKCNYLMMAVMLLQFDGIVPVVNGTDDEMEYSDNVKGIGCYSDTIADFRAQNDLTADAVTEDPEHAWESTTEANNAIESRIDERFRELELKLTKTIMDQFVEISFRLNETANDLLHH